MSDDAYRELHVDPSLSDVVNEHGPFSPDPADDPFERLAVSIVNQQLSTTTAATIRDRLFDRVEATPEGILAVDEDVPRDCDLPNRKVGCVRNVADAFRDGLSAKSLREVDDGEVVSTLTEIRGVGDWTAKMFLIFVLAREDVFPVEDLGIRRGMEHVFGFEQDVVSRGEMRERAERWAPYQSYANRYLWRCVDRLQLGGNGI